MQGQDANLESLFAKTSSFSNTLADNGQTVQQLIDNLNTVVATISKATTGQVLRCGDKLNKLIWIVVGQGPDGQAVTALDNGTASLTDLLG